MAARKGSGSQMFWRFILSIATGWLGFDALCFYLYIRHIDLLRDGPYHPNVQLSYLIGGSVGTFLFFWTFFTIPSIMNAHGGAIIVLSVVDAATILTFSVALGLQSPFLPHEEGKCGNARAWQVSKGTPSLFEVMARYVAYPDHFNVESVCRTRTRAWRWGIGVMVCYGIVATCNMLFGIGELGRSSSYWIHDHAGNRNKWSRKDICMSFPLYVIEWMMETLWRLVPTKITLRHRYFRRYDAKKHNMKKYQKQRTKELGPVLMSYLQTGQHPDARLESIIQRKKDGNEKPRDQKIVEIVEKTSMQIDSAEIHPFGPGVSSENIFERLPWHLIVNDILPYLHHIDLVNFLLTSRSTYRIIIPNYAMDRALIGRKVCQIDDLSSASSRSSSIEKPTHCFSCAIPVCSSCSHRQDLAETPETVHSRTCRAVCSTCFRSHLSQKPKYYDRRETGPCICGHNTIMAVPEVVPESAETTEETEGTEDAGATEAIVATETPEAPEAQQATEVAVENQEPHPTMACWSALGQGGVLTRVLCRQCNLLSKSRIRRKREERYRRHRTIVRDVDGPGNDQAYECQQCHSLQVISRKKKPVMFFMCQQCNKECRYDMHDCWLVRDVYRKQAHRILKSLDCIISIDEKE